MKKRNMPMQSFVFLNSKKESAHSCLQLAKSIKKTFFSSPKNCHEVNLGQIN